MALACLAKISPIDTSTGNRVDIYVSNINDAVNGRKVNGLNGVTWMPGLVVAPQLKIQLWNGDFQSAASPGGASLALNMVAVKQLWPSCDAYSWVGAPVVIYAEEIGTAWPWSSRFNGNVLSFARDKGQNFTIEASVDDKPFGVDILTGSYAGTGGAEGSADLKNRPKPLVLGWAMNVEPVLIDAVNNVHQFSAYGAIEGVTKLYERGSDFGAATADYATYAALVAATVPAGRWATCLAAGMVRLGAPAYGVITGDIKGHRVGATTPRLSGAIISALATIAGVSSGIIETASLSAMDVAKPYNANIVLDEKVNFIDVARGLALGVNHQSGISLTGKFFVAKPALTGTELITLEAQGRRIPQVVVSQEETVSAPYFKTILGANRNWRVQTADEIAFTANLIDVGIYSGATTYREGNIVQSADGSQWLYINPVPTAGNAPPTWPTPLNAYWSNMAPPTLVDWQTGVVGGNKPSDNAGTSGLLTAMGSFQQIRGNTTWKAGGTHGSYQGGLVGAPLAGSAFISSSAYALRGGGWAHWLALDGDGVAFQYANMNYAVNVYCPSTGTVQLDLHVSGAFQGSKTFTGCTVNTRVALVYDGQRVSVLLDGADSGLTVEAPSNQVLYPKILEIYDGLLWSATQPTADSIRDIIYGPYQSNTASSVTLYNPHTLSVAAFSINGNAVTKTAHGTAGFHNVYSRETLYGNAIVTGVMATQDAMFGLTTTAGATTYATVEYAVHKSSDGNWYVYSMGANMLSMGTALNGVTFSAATVWSVAYDGIKYRAFADGVLMHSMPASATLQTVRAVASIYLVGARIANLAFGSYTSNVWADIDGNGVPEEYATTGQNLIYNGNAERGDTAGLFVDALGGACTFGVGSSYATNGTFGFILSKPAVGNHISVAGRAIPVKAGRKYLVKINLNGSTATASGLYLRMQEKSSAPANGIWINGGEMTSYVDLVASGPIPGVNTDFSYIYTPTAGAMMVSPTLYNYINGPLGMRFDDFTMTEVVDWAQGVSGTGKPADNATVGATWGVNVGGSNKPADNATVGATWGVDVASRPTELTDGRVAAGIASGGNVNTNKVLTSSIVNGAVSNLSYAYTASDTAVPITPTWGVAQTLTLTATGVPLIITAGLQANWILGGTIGGGGAFIRIARDGVILLVGPAIQCQNGLPGYSSFVLVDVPTAASHTYTIETAPFGDPATVSNRFLSALEMKK